LGEALEEDADGMMLGLSSQTPHQQRAKFCSPKLL